MEIMRVKPKLKKVNMMKNKKWDNPLIVIPQQAEAFSQFCESRLHPDHPYADGSCTRTNTKHQQL